MSVARTRRNSLKPQIIKFDNNEDNSSKATGMPCIDFQPDDRWQINEEDSNSLPEKRKTNSPTHKRKESQVSNKSKNPAIVNGESTAHESDSENTSKNISASNNVVNVDENCTNTSKEECNKEVMDISSPDNSSVKRNCRIKKKRKSSSCDSRTNGKKAKSPPPNENSNDSIINCSSGDEKETEASDSSKSDSKADDKISAPVLKNETKADSDNEKEDLSLASKETSEKTRDMPDLSNNENSPSDTKKNDCVVAVTESKKSASVAEITQKDITVEEVSMNDSVEKTKKNDSVEKTKKNDSVDEIKKNDSVDEIKKNDSVDEIKKNDSVEEIKKNDSVDEIKKNDAISEITEIIVNKKSGNNSEAGDSDNEIQIIEGTSDEKVKSRPLLDQKICEKSMLNNSTSIEELLLSPGYPYYNLISEKVKGLKPGVYNPVKFPHMGTLLLSDSEVIIESPSLLVPLLIKEADEFPKLEGESSQPEAKQKPMYRKNFFQSSVGQFLIHLGASRVLEWYHRDMKRSVIKQVRKSGPNKELSEAIQDHERKCIEAKEANLAFNFRLRRCEFCDFKTESLVVMEAHYLTPHMSLRREYKCNFCEYLSRDAKEITFHYEAIHGKKAVLENQMLLHECLFCTFQSHLKSKVSVHMNRCRKNFIQSQNQSPPYDFEFPGVTTKPVSLADINGHRRLLLGSVKAQPGTFESYVQSAFAKKKLSSVLNYTGMEGFPDSPTLVKHLMGPHAKQGGSGFQLPPGIVLTRPRVRAQQMRQLGQSLQPRGLPPIRPGGNTMGYPSNIPSGISITPVQKQAVDSGKLIPNAAAGMKNITLTPISSAGNQLVSKSGPPQPVALFTNVAGNDTTRGRISGMATNNKLPVNMSGRAPRMVPPFQRLNTPPSQVVKNSSGSTFVMCEICDAYIKDLEELRSHMNWVHKVKIHPKMLVSRPPLNCQKCQWRFFTDQGLERHLLGAHGLVTTNMQEMANNNQDGGRCIICGAVFTYKLVSHMTQVHKVTLKPAHLSYKCTVCTATFTLYRLFESHVYNVHSGSAKRNAEEPAPSEPPAKKVAPEPKEIVKEPVKETSSEKCKDCGFITSNLEDHIKAKHMKDCSVKLCRINKCEKCLYSTDELLVIRMSDFGDEDDSSENESDDDSSSCASSEKGDDCKKVTPASHSIKNEATEKSSVD